MSFLSVWLWVGVVAVDGGSGEDAAAVRAAVEDYVLALYDVAPERVERSVHPELVKYGFSRRSADEDYRGRPMTYAQLVELAGEWNASGDRAGPDSPREIQVLGVLPEIACAKLTAAWGIDYMNLAREDGRWKIRQVLWQRPMEDGVEAVSPDDPELMQAGLDYVEAFYEVKPERIDRSVSRSLTKYGLYRRGTEARSEPMTMTFDSLRSLAERLHAQQAPEADAPKVVQVLDAMNHTALLRIVGHWGVDYVQADPDEGSWKIRHVLWQSHVPGHRVGEEATALNRTCPFSGKPVRADSLSGYQGRVVGFCNPGCAGKFAKWPEAYLHRIEDW